MNARRTILIILLAALLLSGCAGRPVTEPAPSAPEPTVPPPTAAPTPVPTPVPTPSHPPEQFPYDYEKTLADDENIGLAVTALGVDWEDNWVVHLRLENRTGEIQTFRFIYQSINGLALDEVLEYRVAVGGSLEPSFRILRQEMADWGFDRPVLWRFTLKVSSSESTQEPLFYENLSASPFGEEEALPYVFEPGPLDRKVMDNKYAAVYITGWQPEDGALRIDYVAVNKCDQPLLLVLPDGKLKLDGRSREAVLKDGFGPGSTLMGSIPVEPWEGLDEPARIELKLALADPSQWGDPLIKGTQVNARLKAAD